jgi:hypothetical protein
MWHSAKDVQHNDARHNDTQHDNTFHHNLQLNDTQFNDSQYNASECNIHINHNATEYIDIQHSGLNCVFMLSVIILRVFVLHKLDVIIKNVVMPRVVAPRAQCYKTFYDRYLRRFVWVKRNTWKLLHSGKLRPYLWLNWKGLLGTNTLAYYELSQITAVKSFIILCPGVML